MTSNFEPKFVLNELKRAWLLLHEKGKVCKYKLNITEAKLLGGFYNFYAELHEDRFSKRREPQMILSVDQQFDNDLFNFKKISPMEVLMIIPNPSNAVTMIINNCPLTQYHTLICPGLHANFPQRITLAALNFSVEFLMALRGNRNLRIGYNSPGAMASVNHLHLHLIHIERDLYIDNAKLKNLSNMNIFRLDESMPTEAICCLIRPQKTPSETFRIVERIHNFLKWLCFHDIPHNIFITPDRFNDTNGALKMFIFAREAFCIPKDPACLNIGYCELSGFIPVGDKELYGVLKESDIISAINKVTGNVYKHIYKYFKNPAN